jgi:hypothetical protein
VSVWENGKVSDLVIALSTDFNSIDERGRVATLRELGRVFWYEPAPGVLLRLHDGDGNYCYGVVDEVHGDLILATPYWRTWESPSTAKVTMTTPIPAMPGAVTHGEPVQRPASMNSASDLAVTA